ncbi:MAG: biotin-dependent carboxyltransferase family protein [Anaerolineae bacterium]
MLEIWEPGLLTTVQDAGRVGWARFGVPPSGPLDAAAFRAANQLVGNPKGAAGLEITLTGPTLRCSRPSLVAVCGADFELWAGTLRVPTWHAVFLRAGQWLRFGARRRGARAYLAIDGGIDVPPFLDSRSTYLPGSFGGLEGRALRAGDRLPLGEGVPHPAMQAGRAWPASRRPPYTAAPTLRVVLGPQDDYFTSAGLETFLNVPYKIRPDSNRMGARLQGPRIAHRDATGIVSDGVVAGSVQVPADGQPIVMLADHQTTGGYPKIATVIRADLPLLAQCLPGDAVRFEAVSVVAAQTLCWSSHAGCGEEL